MLRFVAAGLAWLILASALAGCGQRCAIVDGGAANPVAPQPPDVRVARGKLAPDLSVLASYEAVDQSLGPPPPTGQYRALRAVEVQCLAAATAPVAKLYQSESEAAAANTGHHKQQAASVESKLLAYRAVEERNKAAGTALEVFYLLAEAEANRDIVGRSIEEVDRAAADLEELKKSGLKVPLDQTAISRQKLDWLDRRIQLYAAARQMQGQLQQLCGLEIDETLPLWPDADLAVIVAAVDVPAAVVEGLAHRADVRALRMLSASLSADTLSAARGGVQPLGSGLGASMVANRLFGGRSEREAELPSRRAQLAEAQAETERTARREIADAAHNVETQLRAIAVAKQRQELWSQRVADLQEKRESDGVTAFDISAARLELFHAESDTLHRVIAWRLAQAKLKQTQGVLAAECGYRLPGDCR